MTPLFDGFSFLATTADRFYRIDRAQVFMLSFDNPYGMKFHFNSAFSCENFLPFVFQEHLNYVTEISQNELFILDPELVTKETVGTSTGMPEMVDTLGENSNSSDQIAFPACPAGSPPLYG